MKHKEISKRTRLLVVRAYDKLTHLNRYERAFEQRLARAGLRYRMQWLMEPWIVDFYLPDERLVIEVDGNSHDGRDVEDARRTAGLRRRNDVAGVARVRNEDVDSVRIEDIIAGMYDHKVGDILYPVRRVVPPVTGPRPSVLVRRRGVIQ